MGIKLLSYKYLNDNEEEIKNEILQNLLNQILDAENIIILAGSGTSLTFNEGDKKIAPSMTDLWDACHENNKDFNEIKEDIGYDNVAKKWKDENGQEQIYKDIELFLSRCDHFLSLGNLPKHRLEDLEKFINTAKNIILEKTDFTNKIKNNNWKYHNKLLRVFGKRQTKQKRLKLFTTNYDLAFETAASNIGMTIIDGFEYSRPYRFNPSWFNYDIVHRVQSNDKSYSYLPNVFHLYKIHGSIDWIKTNQGIQKKASNSENDKPVIIYPSSNKYQTSYEPPYLDMMASFLNAIQQPRTAILCLGFGFNDKHINNAITMALRTNPELLLMVSTLNLFSEQSSFNKEIKNLFENAIIESKDPRISLIDCSFAEFVEILPDRNKTSPEEELFKKFQNICMEGLNNV